MKAIKDRRNLYATLSVAAILLTVLLLIAQKMEATIACGGLTAVVLILLCRQSRLLGAAMVIYDSRILTITSSVVTSENRPNQTQAEETILSTFGLLLGKRVYRWGCDGVYGVRLREVQIDKEHVCLSFGAYGEILRVEVLHGMTQKQAVLDVAQKLLRETGVTADISGW